MPLTFAIGGARSGKSTLALRMAAAARRPVFVIATAEGRDDEMKARIERHRSQRPEEWNTIEEPLDLESALCRVPQDACALVDCLTLWVANLIEQGADDRAIERRARNAAHVAAARAAPTIVVSNEVGSGVVPVNALARRYRDLLGTVNTLWAEAAEQTVLVVAGHVVVLSPPEMLLGAPVDR